MITDLEKKDSAALIVWISIKRRAELYGRTDQAINWCVWMIRSLQSKSKANDKDVSQMIQRQNPPKDELHKGLFIRGSEV